MPAGGRAAGGRSRRRRKGKRWNKNSPFLQHTLWPPEAIVTGDLVKALMHRNQGIVMQAPDASVPGLERVYKVRERAVLPQANWPDGVDWNAAENWRQTLQMKDWNAAPFDRCVYVICQKPNRAQKHRTPHPKDVYVGVTMPDTDGRGLEARFVRHLNDAGRVYRRHPNSCGNPALHRGQLVHAHMAVLGWTYWVCVPVELTRGGASSSHAS